MGAGGGGGICPLLNLMCPPLEFALYTPTLHGAPPKMLNRPLCPLLQKLLDETLMCTVYSIIIIYFCNIGFCITALAQIICIYYSDCHDKCILQCTVGKRRAQLAGSL